MHANSSTSWAGPAPAAAARFVPIVTRAAETGRGPPWLVRWVRDRVGPSADARTVRRLAGDLARLVTPAGVAETLPDRP
jgi:hypothetical protein